jgi:lysophospholipase L1-like esterase
MGFPRAKLARIAGINILILGVSLASLDLLLGKYFSEAPALDIPAAQVDIKSTYETSKIENSAGIHIATYTRDYNGYRPYRNAPRNNKLILTVGGSTTDQRWVDDRLTWQRELENKLGIPVLNGGVDGQSSFGHLLSIENWHAKVLNPNYVDKIIFLVGVNDVRFTTSINAASGNRYDSPTFLEKIRSYIVRRSFLVSRFRAAFLKLSILRGSGLAAPNGVSQIGYGDKNPSFLREPVKSVAPKSEDYETDEYKHLFLRLLTSTKRHFKNSKIYIVQQQDPKCVLDEGNVLIRVSRNELHGIDAYCSALASIYRAQENAIRDINSRRIITIKMYQDNPVPDLGFHDGIHTNSLGSKAIGDYLAKELTLIAQ